jgi:hypothetical protein
VLYCLNAASVSRHLAAAANAAEAGNLIVLGACGGYIENLLTNQGMTVRKERATFVMDGEYANREFCVITLDSSAGGHHLAREAPEGSRHGPDKEVLKMCAANRTSIASHATKLIKFIGNESLDFTRRT